MLEYADLAQYVERAKAQDECAFTYLYERTVHMVYNIACTLLQNEEEAKDAVSEVYIRVFRHITSLKDNRSFIRWLIVITQRVCQDHKQKWRQLPPSIGELPDLEDPNDLIAEWQQKEALRTIMQSLIRQLPEPQQRAIYCVYFKQLSVAQTAALEDCSVNTILSRLYYARNTLRRAILAEEKRTGDRYHLPVATAALSALMALPQIGFTLSPEEAARVLASIFAALGVQYTGEKAPPIMTIITEDDAGQHHSVLVKLRPAFIGVMAAVGLSTAMLLIELGYSRGKQAQTTAATQHASPAAQDGVSTTTASIPTAADASEAQTALVDRMVYTYTVENGAATILSAESEYSTAHREITALAIPSSLNGYPVRSIGKQAFYGHIYMQSLILPQTLETIEEYAFYGCQRLTSIQFPGTLRTIGQSAFSGCEAITELKLPEGLETIGQMAFAHCSSLETITLPESLTFIDANAFYYDDKITSIHLPASVQLDLQTSATPALANMRGLREITVDPQNPQLCAVDGVLYNKDMTFLVTYPPDKPDTHFTVPQTVTKLGSYSMGSNHMISVSLPKGLRYIGEWCFWNSNALTSITVPATVTGIGSNAFGGIKIAEIQVEDGNRSFCSIDGVLYDQWKWHIIRYPAGKTDAAFTIPDTVKTIDGYAFFQNHHLTTLTMSDSVNVVCPNSISNLSKLTTLRLSDNITRLPAFALENNDSITEYVMPKNLVHILNTAVQGCDSLARIVFQGDAVSCDTSGPIVLKNPDCTIAYPRNAAGWTDSYWTNNYKMEPYDPPEAETAAPATTAASTRVEPTEPQTLSVNGITYTYSVTNQAATITAAELDAFTDESAMASLVVPAKLDDWPVTAIGDRVFIDNEQIQSVSLPKSIETIGEYAFYNCKNLSTVHFPGSLRKIGRYGFALCGSLAEINLPQGLETLEAASFLCCYALREVVLPESLTTLGAIAFAYDHQLTTLHLPAALQLDLKSSSPALAYMTGLREITVAAENPQLCAVDGVLYDKDMTQLISYPPDKPDTTFTVPATVTCLGIHSMQSKHMTSITLPEGLETIERYCFTDSTALSAITIPASVTGIGMHGIGGEKIAEIRVEAGNRYYQAIDGVLYNKAGTILRQYPTGKTAPTYAIPDTVTQIDAYAIYRNPYLTSITMTDHVTSIGVCAIAALPQLTALRLSDNIKNLPALALQSNERITEYVMPKSLVSIHQSALQGCARLTRIVFQGNSIAYNSAVKIILQNERCVLAYPRNATGWTDSYWTKNYNMERYDPSA